MSKELEMVLAGDLRVFLDERRECPLPDRMDRVIWPSIPDPTRIPAMVAHPYYGPQILESLNHVRRAEEALVLAGVGVAGMIREAEAAVRDG